MVLFICGLSTLCIRRNVLIFLLMYLQTGMSDDARDGWVMIGAEEKSVEPFTKTIPIDDKENNEVDDIPEDAADRILSMPIRVAQSQVTTYIKKRIIKEIWRRSKWFIILKVIEHMSGIHVSLATAMYVQSALWAIYYTCDIMRQVYK